MAYLRLGANFERRYAWHALAAVVLLGLWLFAANTALGGAYHIIGALADGGVLPGFLLQRSARFGTPTIAIATQPATTQTM